MTTSTASRTCTHAEPHLLAWNATVGGGATLLRDAIKTALRHVDTDVPERTIETVEAVLSRAAALPIPNRTASNPRARWSVEVDDSELAAIAEVLGSASDYMAGNNYADDTDFPEDALAAQVLNQSGAPATVCWTAAFNR